MGIGNHKLDAAQPPGLSGCAGTSSRRVLCFRRPNGHAKNLAMTVRINANSYYNGDRDDAAGLANFDIGDVDPHVRPFAFNRALEKGVDAFVNVGAQPENLALRDTGHADHWPIALARSSAERV